MRAVADCIAWSGVDPRGYTLRELFVIAERAAFKEGVKQNPFAIRPMTPSPRQKTAADFSIDEKAKWFGRNN